jgi:hypothetical protein
MLKFKKMATKLKKGSVNSLLIGVGSVLNVFPIQKDPTFTKVCTSDTHALKSDWRAIGGDFSAAIKKIKK